MRNYPQQISVNTVLILVRLSVMAATLIHLSFDMSLRLLVWNFIQIVAFDAALRVGLNQRKWVIQKRIYPKNLSSCAKGVL